MATEPLAWLVGQLPSQQQHQQQTQPQPQTPPPQQQPQQQASYSQVRKSCKRVNEKYLMQFTKRPKYAIFGHDIIPVTRRTKYIKLLETMSMELAAVKQQLHLAQQRLQLHEPTNDTQVDESTRHNTPPHDKAKSHVTFRSLLPQTRHIVIMSQAQQSLHEATYVHAPMLVWKMDLRQHILDANVAFCETNGWDVSELIGRLLPPGNPARPMYPPHLRFPESDVAPLKNGLPEGLTALDILPTRDMFHSVAQLYTQQAKIVTCTRRHVNAKGQLCESRVTSWLVYEDGPSYPFLGTHSSPFPSSSSSHSFPSSTSSSSSFSSSPPCDCESLLWSFYSSCYPSHESNPLLKQILEWLTPALIRCFVNVREEVGDMIAATFSCRKPVYQMNVTCPSDTIVLRHPASSHPYESLQSCHDDMSRRWNYREHVPVGI